MKVFLSYRRSDSADATARIHDHLEMFFEEKVVFRDIDQMKGGDNFRSRLESELSSCDIGVVMIGSTWESCRLGDQVRLFDPEDPVRMEILKLIELKKLIVPVLLDRKNMPRMTDLPPELAKFTDIQAVQISMTYDFSGSVLELVKRIHEKTGIRYRDFRILLEQCRQTGLTTILSNFLEDGSYRQEIANAKELMVVQNDGRSWIDSNQELLLQRLADKSKTTKILLYHPKSKFLEILDAKNGKGLDQQISEIKGSFRLLKELAIHPNNCSIRAHHGFNPYSLILTEKTAFMDCYLLNKRGALPRFIFTASSPDGFYHTLRHDAYTLYEKSHDLSEDSFVIQASNS